MMKKILVFISLFAVYTCCQAQSSFEVVLKKVNDMVGFPVPNFKAITTEEKKIESASLKGKILVINFWFVGCVPCEEEIPALNQLVNRFKERKDVVFISFAKTEQEQLQQFLKKNTFLYQNVPTAKAIAEKFNVTGYPTQFIIDKTGTVRYTSIGGMDDIEHILAEQINKLL